MTSGLGTGQFCIILDLGLIHTWVSAMVRVGIIHRVPVAIYNESSHVLPCTNSKLTHKWDGDDVLADPHLLPAMHLEAADGYVGLGSHCSPTALPLPSDTWISVHQRTP